MSSKKKCFVISPIGKDNSEIRENVNRVFRDIITPITSIMNYETTRSDLIEKQGLITGQIISSILTSDLIIADLSYLNTNVFYELGISHTVDTPTILMFSKIFDISLLPFDIKDHRIIHYDVENPQSAKSQLESRIKDVESFAFTYNAIDRVFRSQIQSLVFNNSYNSLEKILNTLREAEQFLKRTKELDMFDTYDYYSQLEKISEFFGEPEIKSKEET
jgi:hypothetical protein